MAHGASSARWPCCSSLVLVACRDPRRDSWPAAASPTTASASLTIDVIGHQWWWEVQYEESDPSQASRTANEIHVPVGQHRPVQARLQRRDPQLLGAEPERQAGPHPRPADDTLAARQIRPASIAGSARSSAGMQHAQMAFFIVAEPPGGLRGLARGISASRGANRRRGRPARPRTSSSPRGCAAVPQRARHGGRRQRRARPHALRRRHDDRRGDAGQHARRTWRIGSQIPQRSKPGIHMPAYRHSSRRRPRRACCRYLETLK